MELKGTTIETIIETIREKLPAAYTVDLLLGMSKVTVSTNSEALYGHLKSYFAEFLGGPFDEAIFISFHEDTTPEIGMTLKAKEPEPGKKGRKEAWCDLSDGRLVTKLRTGMVFLFGHGKNLAIGPCLSHFSQVVNFITNRCQEAALKRGALLGHASAVTHGKGALVLAGNSGAGKSTLALHMMVGGATFVSNDRVILERKRDGIALSGVAKHPRVNPGTLLSVPGLDCLLSEEDRERFSLLDDEALRAVQQKADVVIHEVFGPHRFELDAALTAVVILGWGDDEGPRLQLLPEDERLKKMEALRKSPGLFFCPGSHEPIPSVATRDYVVFLDGIPVYELRGKMDYKLAARLCREVLSLG